VLPEPVDDGIVVSNGVSRNVAFQTLTGLVDMNDRDRDELLSAATDRFERRLAEECGKTRAEVGDLRAEVGRLHIDVTRQVADVRLEVADVRLEVADIRLEVSKARHDFTEQFGIFRAAAETRHSELLKWAFVFWLGQAMAVAGLMVALR